MTEKRFIYKIKNGAIVIIDKKDNVLIRDKYRACDYLNQLNDENEQLKKEAEEYNEDAMSYQTLYEQQVEMNKNLNQLIRKIEDNLNKYKLINCLEYEDWKKEIWGSE